MPNPAGIALSELATLTGGAMRGGDVRVNDITHDSRQCQPGMMFACVVGAEHDGHRFAGEAVQAGAVALLVQQELGELADISQLVVDDVRSVLGKCAAAAHHHPSQRVNVVGVTGTAGKTTVCHAIAQMLNAAGRPSQQLGTLDGARTTPESTDLNRWLAQIAAESPGKTVSSDTPKHFAVIEVSSHALALGRVEDIAFAAGVFTNLSQEHLDFHTSMEDYFQVKARLFDGRSALAVINVGCEWGARLRDQLEGTMPVHPYSSDDMSDVEVSSDCLRFTWRSRRLKSQLRGRFNIENLAAAAATGLALGLDEDEVEVGLQNVQSVPGRMQPVSVPGSVALGITVLVDYAHKPEALAAALTSAREMAVATSSPGRLWVVFGTGGDRDSTKRPLMGQAAAALADFVVITSDNSRSEDPAAIAAEIEAGCVGGMAEIRRILSRSDAIDYAIANAQPGDVVLIAGKGHETTQIDDAGSLPFDDTKVATEKLANRLRESK